MLSASWLDCRGITNALYNKCNKLNLHCLRCFISKDNVSGHSWYFNVRCYWGHIFSLSQIHSHLDEAWQWRPSEFPHSLSDLPLSLKMSSLFNIEPPLHPPFYRNPGVSSWPCSSNRPALINSEGFLCYTPINYMAFINTGLMNGLCWKGELRGGVNTAPACTHVATY